MVINTESDGGSRSKLNGPDLADKLPQCTTR
jgi:hypothetical protein